MRDCAPEHKRVHRAQVTTKFAQVQQVQQTSQMSESQTQTLKQMQQVYQMQQQQREEQSHVQQTGSSQHMQLQKTQSQSSLQTQQTSQVQQVQNIHQLGQMQQSQQTQKMQQSHQMKKTHIKKSQIKVIQQTEENKQLLEQIEQTAKNHQMQQLQQTSQTQQMQVQQGHKTGQLQQMHQVKQVNQHHEVIASSTSQHGNVIQRGRSQSATGQACSAAFNAVLPTLASRQSSQDSASSSSDSMSVSDISLQMKEYEDADTLERRDSGDQYLTARGDLSQSFMMQFSASGTPTIQKRSNPVITFDPNDRHKFKNSSKMKSPVPSPKPKAGSVPPPDLAEKVPVLSSSPSVQNVHSDMYNTAFALQSLGDEGTWPAYLTQVRSMWDDKLGKVGSPSLNPMSTSDYGGASFQSHGQSPGQTHGYKLGQPQSPGHLVVGHLHGHGRSRSAQGQYQCLSLVMFLPTPETWFAVNVFISTLLFASLFYVFPFLLMDALGCDVSFYCA